MEQQLSVLFAEEKAIEKKLNKIENKFMELWDQPETEESLAEMDELDEEARILWDTLESFRNFTYVTKAYNPKVNQQFVW